MAIADFGLASPAGPTGSAKIATWCGQRGGSGAVVGDGKYLSVAEVCARLREAGFDDSPQTVRRLYEAGRLKGRRTELGQHRRIEAASVDALIADRRVEAERASIEPTEDDVDR